MKSASEMYMLGTDDERRKLSIMVFSELVVSDGELASYKAKPAFEILLNRPKNTEFATEEEIGSRRWTHLGSSIGAS